jgi:hypothetical protein
MAPLRQVTGGRAKRVGLVGPTGQTRRIVINLWSNSCQIVVIVRRAWPRLVNYLGGLTGLAGRATTGTRANPAGVSVHRQAPEEDGCSTSVSGGRAGRSPEDREEDGATCGSTLASGGRAGPACGAGSSGGSSTSIV